MGKLVGWPEGRVGANEGCPDGSCVGCLVGWPVGSGDGAYDGYGVGWNAATNKWLPPVRA